jgi:hypothetical protein
MQAMGHAGFVTCAGALPWRPRLRLSAVATTHRRRSSRNDEEDIFTLLVFFSA